MDRLSEDQIAVIGGWLRRSELLVVRSLSSAGRGAVQLAFRCPGRCPEITLEFDRYLVKGKKTTPVPTRMSVEGAAALGRVFGGGCEKLEVSGSWNVSEARKTMMLEAVRTFQKANSPRSLDTLRIFGLVMPDALILEMCRANPRLVSLDLDPHGVTSLNRNLLAEIGRACPLLNDISLPRAGMCEAEAFAMHFPNIPVLRFGWYDPHSNSGGIYTPYAPSAFDRIAESAERVKAEVCDFDDCVVKPELVECLLRTSFPSRVTCLKFAWNATLASTLLALVAACPKLQDLRLPRIFFNPSNPNASEGEIASPSFYRTLFRTRPTITTLELGFFNETSGLEAVCQNFPLKTLILGHNHMDFESTAVVDVILASPCRDTLTNVELTYMSATQVLRLVTTMENLKDARIPAYFCMRARDGRAQVHYNGWRDPSHETDPDADLLDWGTTAYDRLGEIMRSRGGEFHDDH